MTLCKHNVNAKYCKACEKVDEKRATILSNFLIFYADAGIDSAKDLFEDILLGKSIPDLSERLTKITDDIRKFMETSKEKKRSSFD